MESVGNILRERLETGKAVEMILRTTKSPDDLDVVIPSVKVNSSEEE